MFSKFNFKQALKMALVGAGAILCLTPAAQAGELMRSIYGVNNPFNYPHVVAYGDDACPRNTYMLRSAETRNYYVWICATEGGSLYYVAQGKNPNRGGISLRIRSYSGERYVATNGNTRYIVTPSRLVVTQGSRTILSERVFQWEEGTGLEG